MTECMSRPGNTRRTRDSDLSRALKLSSVAIVTFALSFVSFIAPYSAQAVLAPIAWFGFYAATGNVLYCLLRLCLTRDRRITAVALALCVCLAVGTLLFVPLIP